MKKTLIALAVMGLSGAAMAQSSVSLYGVADAGLGKLGKEKTHFISGGNLMTNGPSRVGVRGTEDLGGGLRAGFAFETGLSLANGAADGPFWQREANVYLSGNWGTFKMGRQYTPGFLALANYELTDIANYSVLANTFGFVGAGPRVPSAFAYISPTFNGLTAGIGYVSKNDLGTSKAVWDAALLYSNGPISAGLDVNKLSNSKTNYQLGGKYNFGKFALAASYTSASVLDSNAVRRGFGLGGSVNFGAVSVVLDLTRDTKNQWLSGPKKYTNGVAELKYALSKRTFVYGAYLRLDGTNNYGLGLRHNF